MAKQLHMSLSLDLDNKWSYLKTHGSDSWKDYPSYLDVAVPRILDFLREREIRITFFIVGKDASLDKNRDALRMLAEDGHEIASHSFNHDPWLHLYSNDQLHEELERAEVAIEQATGVKVDGFRGPGFSLSEATLSVLHERGYRYDATSFPNLLNPLARMYFFAHSNLSKEEKEQRKALFGSFSDALRPNKPFRWRIGDQDLLELPVTTMPVFKIPIHFSYLIYLARYSRLLATAYLKAAILMCQLTRTEPSLLLHPLDFLGADDDSDISFFPGMDVGSSRKLEWMNGFFDTLLGNFHPITVGEHIRLFEDSGSLPRVEPHFQR